MKKLEKPEGSFKIQSLFFLFFFFFFFFFFYSFILFFLFFFQNPFVYQQKQKVEVNILFEIISQIFSFIVFTVYYLLNRT